MTHYVICEEIVHEIEASSAQEALDLFLKDGSDTYLSDINTRTMWRDGVDEIPLNMYGTRVIEEG